MFVYNTTYIAATPFSTQQPAQLTHTQLIKGPNLGTTFYFDCEPQVLKLTEAKNDFLSHCLLLAFCVETATLTAIPAK